MKKQKNHDGKFSLGELVWLGFNYTCGISFTAAFGSLIAGAGKDAATNVGAHVIWIFVIEGLIAFLCAWAYNKLSRVHTTGNGGTYLFSRANYGRGTSWILSFVQYSSMPIIVTSQTVSMIRINFMNDGLVNAQWGTPEQTQLYLDIIGLVIFALMSSVLFFGIKWFKHLTNVSGIMKWGLTALLFIVVIVAFAWNETHGDHAFMDHVNNSNLDGGTFSNAFMTLFFFFLGFETFVTIGGNVRNPEKNIGRAVIIVMSIAIVFYVVVTIFFIGAIIGTFDPNPNMQVFTVFGNQGFAWFGAIIMIVCAIALKGNSIMQNALYSGGILEPQAREGFIPEKYAELNKDGIPFKASLLNYFINIIFVFIFTILPDLIYINGEPAGGDTFSYAAINAETSLVMIVVYGAIVSVAIKLAFQGKMRANWFEKIAWCCVFIFLVWQLVEFFITSIGQPYADHKYVTPSIDLGYFVLIFIYAVCQYFFYYKPKFNKRMAENPEIQAKLDAEFRVLDDWQDISGLIDNQINEYIKRNKRIFKNQDNRNLKYASDLKAAIIHPKDNENIVYSCDDLMGGKETVPDVQNE